MKRLVFALILFVSACTNVAEYPNYRELAAKTVPTNVELIGNFYNLWTGEVRENAAYCSGVAISPTRIITAGHCIEGAKTIPLQSGVALFEGKIKVRLSDGTVALARIVVSEFKEPKENGAEEARDVALIELEFPYSAPAWASLGEMSPDLQVGDQVAIVGNTFGELTASFTIGVVSYVNRKLESGTFVQTDALSGGGNSGGGVFNMKGELIGILVRGGGGVSLYIDIERQIAYIHQAIEAEKKNNKKPA